MSRTGNERCDILLIGFEGQENLGLRSISAYLDHNGITAGIAPLQELTREEILEYIRVAEPKLVGFSLIFQRMLGDYANLIAFLRANSVNAHLTVGGHYPTFEYEFMLESIPGLDTVVRHEGEETLLELYRNLHRPDRWPEIMGIAFRKNGRVIATPKRPLIADLDLLPFPARKADGASHRGIGIRSIAGSRGCYYDCSFCSIHEFYRRSGPTRRSRSPRHIVQEMKALFDDMGVRIFIFQDDDFFMPGKINRQKQDALLDELESAGLHDQILWRVSCRVDDIDERLLRKMKRYGLASVYLGIESGSEQGLKTFNKRYKGVDVCNALSVLREIDMPFEFGFMMFEPYSTHQTVRDNIDFLKRMGEYSDALVHFCKMSPYAGTAIARRLIQEGRLQGTAACPDYRFQDPRLDLLQTFFAQTFNFRNFDDHGLVERLRFAKFDATVVEKFFAGRFDAAAYRSRVRELIRACNESALETMSMAAAFMESHSLQEVIDNWNIFEDLHLNEKYTEQVISKALDALLHEFCLETSPGKIQASLASWPPLDRQAPVCL